MTITALAVALDETLPQRAVIAGLAGAAAIALAAARRPNPMPFLRDALFIGLLAMAAVGDLKGWNIVGRWVELIELSRVGGALAIAIYLATAISAARGREGILPNRTALFLLMAPFLFRGLFVLTAPALLEELGSLATMGVPLGPKATLVLGRALALIILVEALVAGLGFLLDQRFTLGLRLHGVLLGASVYAALTPILADLGTLPAVAAYPRPVQLVCVVASAVVSQAGLWGITYLVTGLIMGALRGRRPTFTACWVPWREGMAKAAIYAGAFMLILHLLALVRAQAVVMAALAASPPLVLGLAGMVLFPLAKTIVESFDGSSPFFGRLRASYREPWNVVRGLVVGAGVGLIMTDTLPFDTGGDRFTVGLCLGGLAYGVVDLVRDIVDIVRGKRLRLQIWRVYGLRVLLGAIVGGALASYLDAAQIAVVVQKFTHYVAVSYPAAGYPTAPYVIYPLFSKWGATDLGMVAGGTRLFFNESLSGVINWSFAAPLFSINLVLLTAAVQRKTAPLRRLLGRDGVIDLVEQAFRVQRWGLWMAPVIYSFLRLAPDPTWYNQDGAIRTIVASIMSARLSEDVFNGWSLNLFLGLLAYDWLRVLIWLDHMGLRVATLVNASFVVGDAIDEKAGEFLGHGARTRVIPEGIRRFATWGPLLIPFYIPRGEEWDRVWVQAEEVRAQTGMLLAPVQTLLTAYASAAAVVAAAIGGFLVWRQTQERIPRPHALETFRLTNGLLTLIITPSGRGFFRAQSRTRTGAIVDLTRRPVDPAAPVGPFFYLRDEQGALSSLTRSPVERRDAVHEVQWRTPTCLAITTRVAGLRVEAEVNLVNGDAVALWHVRLINLEDRPRQVTLTSFRELALADWDSYERHPSYQALFVGTTFVPALNAIIARNTKLGRKKGKVNVHEVAFHAVAPSPEAVLTGYQDSRACFLSEGTAQCPAGLDDSAMRPVSDDGTAHSFDPAASLALRIALATRGQAELRFVDGYATSAAEAAVLISRYLRTAKLAPEDLSAVVDKPRQTLDRQTGSHEQASFAADGATLSVGWDTARPFAHVLANSLGHGALVTNDGAILSFARNSQQNGLTPFNPDTGPARRLGQTIYVHDIDAGLTDSPGFIPHRRRDAAHQSVFGRGVVVFTKTTPTLEMEHRLIVPPDAPVELRLFTVRNRTDAPKRCRITPYFEMVLSELPSDSEGKLRVRTDVASNAVLFSNPANNFEGGWAFVATSQSAPARETWRGRFFEGPDGDPRTPPFAVHGVRGAAPLSDQVRIAAFSEVATLPPGGSVEIALVLGQCATPHDVPPLIARYASPAAVKAAEQATVTFWSQATSVLRVETDMPAFDRLVNDWLPYQVMAARLWGRLGANQRSGGYGFRDQLQDVLPLTYIDPLTARAQILLNAHQQFLSGDVLQWWHRGRGGDTGLGARNRASDPHLWLPYVVARYVDETGDEAILDEAVRFLESVPIPPGQEGIAFAPRPAADVTALEDHCHRAILRTLKARGAHGLPLMGTGDWNDGLSHVGEKGRGESVWLGFFLHDVLQRFARIAARRQDQARARRYQEEAEALRVALDAMWRGDKFVRAITDAGEEMVFADALSSAWPVLSGVVDLDQGRVALETALAALEKDGLVVLLDPAFTAESRPKPGRIADYPPGVRENGGQYTHGVSWLIDAFCLLADRAEAAGDGTLAVRLRDQAAQLWIKISPLGRADGAHAATYGLAPHQQPADIYFGPGYEGRGGWSWYTGAAARMLSAAYSLLGLSLENGTLKVAPHAFGRTGPMVLKRVVYDGVTYQAHPRAH